MAAIEMGNKKRFVETSREINKCFSSEIRNRGKYIEGCGIQKNKGCLEEEKKQKRKSLEKGEKWKSI